MRRALIVIAVGSLLLIVLVAWLSSRSNHGKPSPAPTANMAEILNRTPTGGAASALTIGARTKTRGCVAQGPLPDPACTPGAVLTTDAQTVCAPGYSAKIRDVSSSTRSEVFAEYGITSHATGEYEVDHMISLELGGSNAIANLWPEPAEPRPGFHEKDKVEDYLHRQVCGGAMTLSEAQAKIATDWYAVYQSLP